jgi:7-cyano-7-deazaguanine synthase
MDEIIGDRVELTFVPMRNMFFLTLAANRAVALGIDTLVTGICQEDNANYPDCRETFRQAMESTINRSLGYEEGEFVIEAPLMFMSKAQSVQLATKLKGCYEALAWSHTSYDGKYPPVDNNHSNVLRAHGFEIAGVPDPLVLRAHIEGLMDLPTTANYDEYRRTRLIPRFA